MLALAFLIGPFSSNPSLSSIRIFLTLRKGLTGTCDEMSSTSTSSEALLGYTPHRETISSGCGSSSRLEAPARPRWIHRCALSYVAWSSACIAVADTSLRLFSVVSGV